MKHKWSIVILVTFLFTIITPPLYAADSISVYTDEIIANTQKKQVGINVNYLLDDDHNRSATKSTGDVLKEMGVKYLRYPGGEKSDSYLWSLSPFDRPLPYLSRIGTCEWPSGDSAFIQSDLRTFKIDPLNFDEFISMARYVDAEPVVVIDYDSIYKSSLCGGITPTKQQILDTAVAWVTYANKTKGYNVKYWEIGNESYLQSYNGGTSASQYASDIKLFSSAMKQVDSSIKIGANGSSSSWWNTVLTSSSSAIDFLVVHEYPAYQWGSYSYYKDNIPNLTPDTITAVNAINTYAPSDARSRLRVAITETGSFDWSDAWPHLNNTGHALVLFEMLGEYLKNTKVDFTLVWNTRYSRFSIPSTTTSLNDALDSKNNIKPSGRVLTIWGNYLKDSLVRTTSTSLVRSFATRTSDKSSIVLFLLNKDTVSHTASVTINGVFYPKTANKWLFKGISSDDLAPTWSQNASFSVTQNPLSMTLDPTSITVVILGDQTSTSTPTITPTLTSIINPTTTLKSGDANNDGKVDGIDFSIWLSHYSQSVSGPANGDFNNSGKVDGVDFTIWLSNYGK